MIFSTFIEILKRLENDPEEVKEERAATFSGLFSLFHEKNYVNYDRYKENIELLRSQSTQDERKTKLEDCYMKGKLIGEQLFPRTLRKIEKREGKNKKEESQLPNKT